jgi:hypothetical protein
MIVELVKEKSSFGDDWYAVYIDGRHVIGSFDKEKAEHYYEKATNDKKQNQKPREVLKREEIIVPSDDKN